MAPRVTAECSAENGTSLHHPSTKGQLTLKKAIETIQETEDGEEYCLLDMARPLPCKFNGSYGLSAQIEPVKFQDGWERDI